VDVARYARQIALPEVGPDGQARICAARVAVVGTDLAAETAATYLRAAGVGSVSPLPSLRGEGQGEGSDVDRWHSLLSQVDLVVRSGFDDDAMAGAAARLGLPVIVVRAQRDVVDLVAFARRPPAPDATVAAPVAAAAAPADGPTAVLAGTLAAAEALHVLAGMRESAPPIRHVRLPVDGREPLVQEIGRPS
jgi:hypothetical protein